MKILLGIISLAVLLISCGKENEFSTDFSTATFINAAPGTASINVLIDTIDQTGNGVAYRSTSGALNVRPGTRNLLLRTANTLLPAGNFIKYAGIDGQVFESKKAYTYVSYDVPAPGTNALKTVRFTDDFTLPTAGTIKIRFLPAGFTAAPVDVTYLRTSNAQMPVFTADSVTVSNISYLGNNPADATLAALSIYRELPAGNYTIKVKNAGTQTVLGSVSLNTIFAGVNKGIFTVYSAGGVGTFAYTINAVRQFP